MQNIIFALGLFLATTASASECPPEWKHGNGQPGCIVDDVHLTPWIYSFTAHIRHGYLDANPAVPFKGNVIYVEGIADSMLNHAELFKRVTDEGYRLIAFDMPDQGGSPGHWASWSLMNTLSIAQGVYRLEALNPEHGVKVLMGWSIGGIMGYAAAAGMHPQWKPDAVILLAPGIAPRVFHVGEGIFYWPPGAFTLRALVDYKFDDKSCPAPFVDAVETSPPYTPASSPLFAIDILRTAQKVRARTIPPTVKGLVLMSSPDDSNVDTVETERVFREKAPHFEYVSYPHTRHMIDAERCEVRDDIANRVGEFLQSL